MSFNFSYRNTYDNIELNLYCCGSEQCKKHHSYGPALRHSYLIHIILSGKGIYRVNNIEYTLNAGDLFIIYPNELIYYESDKDDPWKYIWIGFIGTKAEDYLNNTTLTKSTPVTTLKENSLLLKSIDQIFTAATVESNKNLKILASLYEFMYNLLDEFPSTLNTSKNNQKVYMNEALQYIHLNFQEDISVNDIAKHLSIDRSYLHRLFKKYTNASPQEYILKLKFEKACELLTTTNLRIGDIARTVGYNDPLLFSKTFKKLNGTTPSIYRHEKKYREHYF